KPVITVKTKFSKVYLCVHCYARGRRVFAMSDRGTSSQAFGDAGDLPSSEAWNILRQNPRAQLIDVRTSAEWSYVGVPDLSELGRELITVEWQRFPSMAVNRDFVAETKAALVRAGAASD